VNPRVDWGPSLGCMNAKGRAIKYRNLRVSVQHQHSRTWDGQVGREAKNENGGNAKMVGNRTVSQADSSGTAHPREKPGRIGADAKGPDMRSANQKGRAY